jgi:hypothetical protein
LWQQRKELEKRQVRVVVVTFETGFLAQAYVMETGLSWPFLVDGDRSLYQAYGMLRAGFWDIWGPSTWRVYLKELLRGKLPKKSSGDIHQRGGDILIDPGGIVRMHHIGKGPSDRPSVADILRLIDKS